LEEIGLDGQRIEMINISSAMGGEFARAMTKMSEQVIELGPNPLRDPELDDERPTSQEGEKL
jgi:F420-non-reducing hydrogenase iron-sulfur subunit